MDTEIEKKLIEKTKKMQENDDSPVNPQNNDFYKDFALTIKSVSFQSKRKIGKILILGDHINPIYNAMISVFPEVYYVVSNVSQNELDQFTKQNKVRSSLKTKVIDIFEGSSLTDFYLEFGKFDLVVISGMFKREKLSDRRKRSSIVFLHKNFLSISGIFAILNGEKKINKNVINLLKKMKAFKKVIKSYQKKGISQKYLIFTKKSRLKLFGE